MPRTLLRTIALFLALALPVTVAAQEERVARIGVLAWRGSERLDADWSALVAYLDARIPGWRFELVPVTLVSAPEQVASGDLDFLVTNPGHFVSLERDHEISAIASRLKRLSDGSLADAFGCAIIVRADSDIRTFEDLAGRTIHAVHPEAFGGFQVAWRELMRAGVDIEKAAGVLRFTGFPMDRIVFDVLEGRADAGFVRSGLLEALEAEGRIAPGSLRVLNASASMSHPEAVSTRLYPEWPFAAMAKTPRDLRDTVAIALLTAGASPLAVASGMRDRWTAPLAYRSAREVVEAFRQRDATGAGQFAPANLVSIVALALAAAALGAVIARRRQRGRRQPPVGETAVEPAQPLTPREREVLDLIAEGHSTKEIARMLGISPKTVEYHRANLLRKYEARTSSQLVAKAN